MKKLKPSFLYLFLLFICVNNRLLKAQGLPGVQQKNMFAPSNIKIDGKATEWDNKFQANNKATDLFYTVANDKTNLYLVVQATDPVIAKKILAGGLTFTINTKDQKNSKTSYTVMRVPMMTGLPKRISGFTSIYCL